jgi:antitoxin StbD
MNVILSPHTASISELKRNPGRLLEQSGGEPVAILNHNRPTAYLVPAEVYKAMQEALEDADWMRIVEARKSEKPEAREVSLDEL